MNFLRKPFEKRDAPRYDEEIGQPKTIPESELALDADTAKSLIAGAGVNGTKVGLSINGSHILFVSKQVFSQSDIYGLQRAIEEGAVELQLGYWELPTYPLIVLKVTIFDRPSDPFWLETFPNIGLPDDSSILHKVTHAGKLRICFHFYDAAESLLFRAGYETLLFPGQKSASIILKAEMYLELLPPSVRSYSAAVTQFIQENP
jgi:hypothetical protein